MQVGDLVQSKRYKMLGVVIAKGHEYNRHSSKVTILWLDTNIKTIEKPSGVIKLS